MTSTYLTFFHLNLYFLYLFHATTNLMAVTPGGTFIAQMANYIRRSVQEKLTSMYILPLRQTSSELIKSSFNQFLNMENDIFTANIGDRSIIVPDDLPSGNLYNL